MNSQHLKKFTIPNMFQYILSKMEKCPGPVQKLWYTPHGPAQGI